MMMYRSMAMSKIEKEEKYKQLVSKVLLVLHTRSWDRNLKKMKQLITSKARLIV